MVMAAVTNGKRKASVCSGVLHMVRKGSAALYGKATVHCSHICSLQVLFCFPGVFSAQTKEMYLENYKVSSCQ